MSSRKRKAIPAAVPIAAGTNASFPIEDELSIEGIISDHTEAATITPAANPKRNFWTFLFKFFPRK